MYAHTYLHVGVGIFVLMYICMYEQCTFNIKRISTSCFLLYYSEDTSCVSDAIRCPKCSQAVPLCASVSVLTYIHTYLHT